MERIAQGDDPAFLVVYEQHGNAIYRVAYRLLGDGSLAEDIRHECFMTLLRQPGRFDPTRASLRTFLLAITRNLALAARRRGLRDEDARGLEEEMPDTGRPDPLRRLLRDEARDRVRAAVARLSVLQREALVLVDYEDLSLAEAAAVVGADIGTIKARLHRARSALRRDLMRDSWWTSTNIRRSRV